MYELGQVVCGSLGSHKGAPRCLPEYGPCGKQETLYNFPVNCVFMWPKPTAASEKWKGGGRDVNEGKERDKSKLSRTNRSHTPFNQVVLRREAIVA